MSVSKPGEFGFSLTTAGTHAIPVSELLLESDDQNDLSELSLSPRNYDFSGRESKRLGSSSPSLSLFNSSRSDLDLLLERMDRLEKGVRAKTAPATLVEIINQLEVEGFLPPLLCLLFKKNVQFMTSEIGQRIFQKLCNAATDLYQKAKTITKDEARFFLGFTRKDPLRFFQWLHYVKLVEAAGEKQQTQRNLVLDLPSQIKTSESLHARQTLARDFFALFESQLPKSREVQSLLDSLYAACANEDAPSFQ